MNAKDLSKIKRQFKPDNERFNINEIINIYCKKDGLKKVFTLRNAFDMLDTEVQEYHIKNLKKAITGAFDNKLFDLTFKAETALKSQTFLNDLLKTGLDDKLVSQLVDNILANYKYDTDVVISFINANMILPIKNKKTNEVDDENDYSYNFIMCSINKVQAVTPNMKLDVAEKEITVDANITDLKVSTPFEGFVFPTYTDNCVDVNNVLYYTNTANSINTAIAEDVLGLESKLSAKEQKSIFNAILTSTLGESLEIPVINEVYSKINELVKEAQEEDETKDKISINEIGEILTDMGATNFDEVKNSFSDDFDINGYTDFSIESIVPKKKNSIKIKDEDINVTLSANDLSKIKQTKLKGKKCLIIELSNEIELDGFKIETQSL